MFAGRVALVTGAASPIGRAIVVRLLGGGASVMLADVDTDAQATVSRDDKVETFVGDLSDEDTTRRLVDSTVARFGRIDILVNNAGGGVILPFLEHTLATLKTTLKRNLWTTLHCCRFALPHMIDANYGRVINIGADSVRNGLWLHAAYNAAKGGVHGLTTGLAREFAQYDISFNTVAPCMVRTPLVDAETAKGNPLVGRFLSVIPKGRAAEVDEVAATVAHLASKEAGFITGQIISVNGGSTML